MSDNGHYIFCLDDKYYLYDFLGGAIMELHKELYDTIIKYDHNEGCNDCEYELIRTLQDYGLLQKLNRVPDVDPIEKKIAYLTFAPTYSCNFRCTYCFGDHGKKYIGDKREFSKDSLIQMLNYFFEVLYSDVEQYRVDFVSGGEPLLGIDIIKMAVEYMEEYSLRSGKRVSIWLCTNGSLLNDQIIEYLSFHNISIGISIDGKKEWNDIARLNVNGNGTYEQICKGISLIKQNEKVSRKFKCIWGLCTATNENCDFVDILQHMNDLEFQNIQIRLIRGKDKYNVKKITGQYSHLAQWLLENYLQGKLEYLRMIINNNDQFGKVLKRVMLNHVLIRRCNAGVNKVTICPDGMIYPCDSLVGLSDFIIGNINHSNLTCNLYKDMNINQIPKCAVCDIKYLCGGDCYYNSFMKTGSQFSPDSEFCEIQKYILKEAIVLRYKMQTMNDALYTSFLKEVKRKNDYYELFG